MRRRSLFSMSWAVRSRVTFKARRLDSVNCVGEIDDVRDTTVVLISNFGMGEQGEGGSFGLGA